MLPDRLRRNAYKLLERLARMVEPNRMQPGAYNFCQWRQVITPQIVGSENGQTTGTKKPARGGLSVPVWRGLVSVGIVPTGGAGLLPVALPIVGILPRLAIHPEPIRIALRKT